MTSLPKMRTVVCKMLFQNMNLAKLFFISLNSVSQLCGGGSYMHTCLLFAAKGAFLKAGLLLFSPYQKFAP